MRPDHEGWLSDFIVYILIGSIMIVMVLGQDPVTVWLSKWATLIAGLLALGAAWITVREMRLTEKKQASRFQLAEKQQQNRHQELIDLNLRSERLRVLRAAIPYGDNLIAWGDTIKSLIAQFDKELGAGGDLPRRELLEELGVRIFHCGEYLEARHVSSAQDLFGPGLAQEYEKGLAYAYRLATQRSSVQIALFGMPGQEFIFDRNRALDLVRAALMTVRPLIPVAQIIGGTLKSLALEYQGLAPLG